MGRDAEALKQYEQWFPKLMLGDTLEVNRANYREVIEVAALLQKTGEDEKAQRLLGASLQVMQTRPRDGFGLWIDDARIYALQGENQLALAALRRAVDSGWRAFWRYYLEYDPILEVIRGEPEFQLILEEIKADMANQLMRVKEMEQEGDVCVVP